MSIPHTIRIACDKANHSRIVYDAIENKPLSMQQGTSINLELVLLEHGQLDDLTDITSVRIEIKNANAVAGTPPQAVVEILAAEIDQSLTSTQWINRTGQHITAKLTKDQTTLSEGNYRLIVRGFSALDEATYLSADLRIHNDGAGSLAPPGSNDVTRDYVDDQDSALEQRIESLETNPGGGTGGGGVSQSYVDNADSALGQQIANHNHDSSYLAKTGSPLHSRVTSLEQNQGSGGGGGVTTYQYNVKSFGAVGNGVTDDTAAIQSAIEAAKTAGGGGVFFPSGTYIVSKRAGAAGGYNEALTMYSNIHLKGTGIRASVIKYDGTSSGTGIMIHSAPNKQTRMSISDITLDGSWDGTIQVSLNAASCREVVNFSGDEYIWVNNTEICNAGEDGFDSDGCAKIWITDCYVHDCWGIGVHFAGSGIREAHVINTKFEKCGFGRLIAPAAGNRSEAALDFLQGFDCSVIGCSFSDNVRNIALIACQSIIIDSNNFDRVGNGTRIANIYLLGTLATGHAIISNNSFYQVGGDCIGIYDNYKNVKISGNVFTGGSKAINIYDANNVEVTKCVFDGVQDYGINFTACSSLIIDGCHATTNSNGIIIAENPCAVQITNSYSTHTGGGRYVALIKAGGTVSMRDCHTYKGADLFRVETGGYIDVAGSTCSGKSQIWSSGNKFNNVKLKDLVISGSSTVDNDFFKCELNGAYQAYSGGTLSKQKFNNSTGAMIGAVRGLVALSAGVASITCPMTSPTSRVRLERRLHNGSSAMGHLSVSGINPSSGFTIQARTATVGIATGDSSEVYWEMVWE